MSALTRPFAVALCTLCGAAAWAGEFEPLAALVRIGPWPAVSGLIGYGERLWFANSVKFVDHNSADLYSYDPRSGRVRYERHLFSQDVGQPTVGDGLLYWPFEDARFSVGRGEFMVTDGREWRWRTLPFPRVLHLHAMLSHDGHLYAATGGFVAALYRSGDQGRNWQAVYRHRNAPNALSRLVSLGVLDGRLYAGIETSGETGVALGRLDGDRLVPVPGWPRGTGAGALTAYRRHLYAVHHDEQGRSVWRTDGRTSEPVRALAGREVQAMAADADALWAVTGGSHSELWASADGAAWQRVQTFDGDVPVDVAVHAGRPYVGAIGADGRGVLFGPRVPAPVERAAATARLPPAPASSGDGEPLDESLAVLDAALADPGKFEQRGGVPIELLEPLIASGTARAAQALASRIGRAAPGAGTSRFAGRRVPAADKADWQLLWALARTARGEVPLSLLARPWRAARHRSEKYVEPVAAAAWAASESRQADDATVSALVGRLGRAGDPDWLAGDLVGALTVLSGCRFGYDAHAWRAWRSHRVALRDRSAACDALTGRAELLPVPGGMFTMGDAHGESDEVPRPVSLQAFRMMPREVTNREFREFVAATGYVTDARRSRIGHVWTDRWRPVAGANWLDPQGTGAGIGGLDEHPVVQVSARDAQAYCAWRGLRLPTEEEWEFAARGTDRRRYPWGREVPAEGGSRRANYGAERCCAADAADGFLRTAPVGSFPAGVSPFGLYDMAGNVWEWTSSAYAAGSGEVAIRGGGWGNDAYCLRTSYRHGNPPDIGLDMVGFRCAAR